MTLEELYMAAVQDANSGQYSEAIHKLELILTHEIDEDDKASVCSLLGSVYLAVGSNEKGVERLVQALSIAPNNPVGLSNLSEGWRKLGRVDDAVETSRKALALKPDYAEAYSNLGNALQNQGNLDEAITSYRHAVALKPDFVDAYSNMGNALQAQGKLDEAITSYRHAVALKPDYAEAYSNLGTALQAQGNLDEAMTSYRRAVALKPDYAEAYSNLGTALQAQGKPDEAMTSYRHAVALKPDYADAHSNLGNALQNQGKLDEAMTSYRHAVALKPDYAEAYRNMGLALRDFSFSKPAPGMSETICKILEKDNLVRPIDISTSAISLLKFDPIIQDSIKKQSEDNLSFSLQKTIISLSNIPLLMKIMDSCPIADLDIELLLKGIRFELLSDLSSVNNNPDILPFQLSLAMQCFINEYLYEKTDAENQLLVDLEDLVKTNLAKGGMPTASELACLSSYKSLSEYSWVSSLPMPIELETLQRSQILELEEENALRSVIPRYQAITDTVSSKVQRQYEQSPYPRWISLGINQSPQTIPELASELKLKIHDTSINGVSAPKVLIAGCGTGQHSIGSASRLKDCDVLAIDLSLSSLAYAKRKTAELGISNIEYMHADILDVGKLNRKFDIIESVGVLHHMDDPMAGWKVLADCLNAGGLMKIGLYSELARKHVVKIRDEIQKSDISSNDDALRSFRSQIVNSEKEHHKRIFLSSDFYSMSTYRDLLFHVQEHRFTIPQIKACLEQLGLSFSGFEHKNMSKMPAGFSKETVYCLDKWDEYEKEIPSTFMGMYQFWCQKV